MNINYFEIKGIKIAEIVSNKIIITDVQDALDIMGDCYFNGTNNIIVKKENIIADFFDLKTKLAGDILQKFSTYNANLAIVGDFSEYNSKSLKDFIYESNKIGRICFVKTVDEAKERLSNH